MPQPDPVPDRCLFCQDIIGVSRAKEHVLPRWLLDYLNLRDVAISPTHLSFDGEVRSVRNLALPNLIEGRVCKSCNNGWMKDLEDTSKPILTQLFDGYREVTDLSSSERLTVARWAAKTAYVLNSASNYDQHVPADHYTYLRDVSGSLPSNVIAVGQLHNGDGKFYWYQGGTWATSTRDASSIESLELPSYKVTLQLKQLLLLVAWWPHPGWRYAIAKGIHVPLWPQRGAVAAYDEPDFPWDNSIEAVVRFHMGLFLARNVVT